MKKDEKFESLLKEHRSTLEKLAALTLQKEELFNEYLDSNEALYNYIDEMPEKSRKTADRKVVRIQNKVYEEMLAKLPERKL